MQGRSVELTVEEGRDALEVLVVEVGACVEVELTLVEVDEGVAALSSGRTADTRSRRNV